jgi:hypothetical protein
MAFAAFVCVIGLATVSASAAPFITVNLLARKTGSGNPFSSSVTLAPGETADYAVSFVLSPSGSTNPFATNTTIGTWVESADAPQAGDPAIDPTSGLGSIRFSLSQNSGQAGRVTFTQTASGNTTNPTAAESIGNGGTGTEGSWTAGTGAGNGALTARGDGAQDLIGVAFIRQAGTFDGIDASGTPISVEVNNKANSKSRFTAQAFPGTSTLSIGTQGLLATDPPGGMRWRDGGGAAENTTISNPQQTASTTAGNPIIQYNSLSVTVTPEPTSLALLGVAGFGLIRRRKA